MVWNMWLGKGIVNLNDTSLFFGHLDGIDECLTELNQKILVSCEDG